jgi:hypothetical protein
MKSIDDIRNGNLEILIREYGGDRGERGGVTRLAELMQHNSSAQISQWRKRSPNSKTGKPRVISTESARKLERACGKPAGWMDKDQSNQLGEQVATYTLGHTRATALAKRIDALAVNLNEADWSLLELTLAGLEARHPQTGARPVKPSHEDMETLNIGSENNGRNHRQSHQG